MNLHVTNKFVPKHPNPPPPPDYWNELLFPKEFPLAFFEMSFLLPHFLKEGRGKLDVYFTRVYNPLWTNPDGFSWMEVLQDEDEDRPARRAHADVERDGVVRRLHPADGARHRAPRHDEPGDARRPVARLPPAGAARRAREARRDDQRDARSESRRGVGRERVLDRAHLEDRSRRLARHPQVLRVAVPARRADHGRRVLRLDVRELGARPAGGGREGEPDAARSTCGSTASSRSRTRPTAAGYERRDGRRAGAGVGGRTACRCAGFNTPSRKLEFYSPTLVDWGWPEHAVPRYVPGHVHWRDLEARRGRVRSAAELPAADAHPHALAGEVAVRDLAQQPAVDRDRRTRGKFGIATGDLVKVRRGSATSSRAPGSPKASVPACSACRTTSDAGG